MCDKCPQLETDIQRYRKLLALGLDPLTIERIDGVIQELVQPKPAYSLTANRPGTSTGFSPRRGRKAAGLLARVTHACDPLGRFLLARALRGELPDDAALLTHQGVVSVNLAGKSRPAASEMFQSLGLS